jgi:hypothetical protein
MCYKRNLHQRALHQRALHQRALHQRALHQRALHQRALAWTSMRWFRSHVRFGSRLALFALTVQFALAFTHVHLDDAGHSAESGIAVAASVQPAPDVATEPVSSLPKPHSHGRAGDICSICTLLQMAGSVTRAAAPELSLPMASDPVIQSIGPTTGLQPKPHAPAQARAPPSA